MSFRRWGYTEKSGLFYLVTAIWLALLMRSELCVVQPAAAANLPFLTTEGQDIVSETGEKVFLKGPNFGGWLLWEGMVFDLPNNPEHQLRRQMEERMEPAAVDSFFARVRSNFILPEDFRNVKALGFNVIRLPFHHRYVQENPTILDSAVAWAKAAGIYIILDFHAAPGSQNPDYHSDSDGRAEFWSNPNFREKFIQLWEILAERYKDESTVAGYEILNEPVVERDEQLADLYDRTIARIRKIDRRHIIFLDGNQYAHDLSVFERPFGANTVLVFHTYEAAAEMRSLVKKHKKFSDRLNVPLMCNEFDDYSSVPIFEKNNIHWIIWTYKSPYESYPFYMMPPDLPWKRWLRGIAGARRHSEEEIRQEAIASINQSTLPSGIKQQLSDILSSDRGFAKLKSTFPELARSNPSQARELKRVSAQIRNIMESSWIDAFAYSLNTMSRVEMDKLMESLRTEYWIRGNN